MTSSPVPVRGGRRNAASTLPVQVAKNLILRYLDRNREFYTEEFLEAAHPAPKRRTR